MVARRGGRYESFSSAVSIAAIGRMQPKPAALSTRALCRAWVEQRLRKIGDTHAIAWASPILLNPGWPRGQLPLSHAIAVSAQLDDGRAVDGDPAIELGRPGSV